ncbi:TerD family protein [Nocardia sp. NBC_00881]|uniref:TerD family protein n=1 Tax=Nocardia sp. NBC_00881 TaxID=2975995 RepID=UPI00386A58ED|nr:TerD family protein [Nocardia sp. NBC_00881]
MASAPLRAVTEKRALVLAEIYLPGDRWRLRAVGHGYPTDPARLARDYGVEVEE